YPHVDDVIPLMAEGRVLPYLDVPFQHGAPAVLKRMRRPAAQEKTLERIRAWRRICPDLTLRSTFIVGFPGETEAEFAELLAWLDEAQLERVGCFKYSPVEGAAANALPDHVPPQVQEERYARFMERAALISARRLAARVGRVMRVLIDEVSGDCAVARSAGDAPQIDGVVRIAGRGAEARARLRAGEWADVEIVSADAYDLSGRLTAVRGEAAATH
ncbi:MAG: radical SAM protein, partial [Gammaproteobacteria bacterium]|nr:radical SAM protein [Gammaproteobacteria bacterium]